MIFLTGKSSPLDVIKGIRAGAKHYVTKPFNLRELLDKVDGVLGSTGTQP